MQVWKTHFTERELKEVEYCRLYQRDFSHGTDGHNIRLIVAKMAGLLDGGLVPLVAQLPSEKAQKVPSC